MGRLNPIRSAPFSSFRPTLLQRVLAVWDRCTEGLHRGPKENRERRLGRRGEELAYWFLRRQGYTIVARNYRPPRGGEIDLIAWEGEVLVFVEVKSRTRQQLYSAERAVNEDKRRRLLQAARCYVGRKARVKRYRFDIVTVCGPEGATPEIALLRDAFRDRPLPSRQAW